MPLIIISFIAGVLTILAPCILPLLPVIVGRSITDTTLSKRRVVVVVTSLGLSVVLFTLILKASTLLVNIPQDFWKYISGGIILIFGLVTLFPKLWGRLSFTAKLNQGSNKLMMAGYEKNNFWGDVIVGAALGPIFSACSPTYFVILATVLPVSLALGTFYLLIYALGLSLALLVIALLGQRLIVKLGWAVDPEGWFKKILGIIFILVAIGILTGYDKELQTSLLDSGFLDVTKIEQKFLDSMDPDSENEVENTVSETDVVSEGEQDADSTKPKVSVETFLTPAQKAKQYILAPDISTPDGFINTGGKSISISEFKGDQVVLLDIWTYSCINCQRTLPYLNSWYEKYKDKGLVIIGLHTPEFAFERVLANVQDAVEKFQVKYPVVLDNDFSTWNAYKNRFWPRKYLIDIDGYIVYDHAGEGDYAETELAIQKALRERKARLDMEYAIDENISDPDNKVVVDFGQVKSPEIYFGSARNDRLANGVAGKSGEQTLSLPSLPKLNALYLGGTWNFDSEYAENSGGGEILFKYDAKNVYMVASSVTGADLEVYLDGALSKTIHIKEETLYTLVEGADYAEHTLLLKVKSPGIEAFTFTFG